MEKFEIVLGIVVFAFFMSIVCIIYQDAATKQEYIKKYTGEDVPKYKAISFQLVVKGAQP
jgi:hypothetical protein